MTGIDQELVWRGVCFEISDDGEIGLEMEDGDDALEMDAGDPVIVSSVYPEYEGPYEVTPAAEAQVLETKGKALLEKVTVAPIPNNYGLITYNGRTITVS